MVQLHVSKGLSFFDPSKPVQTLDGRAVRILCADAAGYYPIVALVLSTATKGEYLLRAKPDGKAYSCQPFNELRLVAEYDLVNVAVKRWLWVFQYPKTTPKGGHTSPWLHGDHYFTREEAEAWAKNYGQELVGRIHETEVEEAP